MILAQLWTGQVSDHEAFAIEANLDLELFLRRVKLRCLGRSCFLLASLGLTLMIFTLAVLTSPTSQSKPKSVELQGHYEDPMFVRGRIHRRGQGAPEEIEGDTVVLVRLQAHVSLREHVVPAMASALMKDEAMDAILYEVEAEEASREGYSSQLMTPLRSTSQSLDLRLMISMSCV